MVVQFYPKNTALSPHSTFIISGPIIPNSFFPIMFDLGVDSSVSSMIHRMLLASTSTCTEGHPCFKCQPFLMQPTTISHDKPKTV